MKQAFCALTLIVCSFVLMNMADSALATTAQIDGTNETNTYTFDDGKSFDTSISKHTQTIRQALKLFNQGNAAVRENNFDGAIEAYSDAIDLVGSIAILFQNRGTVYARTNQLQLAITDYKQALQIDPTLVAVHRSLYPLGIVLMNSMVRIDRRPCDSILKFF